MHGRASLARRGAAFHEAQESIVESEQARTLQSLRSVRQFLVDHAELLPLAVRLRERLDQLLEELAEHANAQEAARVLARQATAHKHLLRRKLVREHMAPIALIAQEELPHTAAL